MVFTPKPVMLYHHWENHARSAWGSAAVITEALERLNIRYRLAGATECYNKGQSTQIPVSLGIKTPSRFKRMLIVGKSKINA